MSDLDKRTAQEARDEGFDDCISRAGAIDALAKAMPSLTTPDGCGEFDHDIYVTDEAYVDCMQIIHELPSAQPYSLDEWCHGCKEYDAERHCCPRFNRVIRDALKMRKRGKWIIKDNPGTGWYRVTCSECGEDVTSTALCIGFYPNAKVTWNYCPECGADLREGGEDDS